MIDWKRWFRREPKPESDDGIDQRNLLVSDAIATLAKTYDKEQTESLRRSVASLSFLAVLTGTGDAERLYYAASTLNRLATNALDEFEEPKPADPQEELNRLIERGVDILGRSIATREWALATEHLAKIMFLDELLGKMKRGEIVPVDQWPDVVG